MRTKGKNSFNFTGLESIKHDQQSRNLRCACERLHPDWRATGEFAFFSFFLYSGTYVKTKKREVEPTRRQAAVHTGMKELAFMESAPLAGILSSARSSESRRRRRARQPARAGARLPARLCGRRPTSTPDPRRGRKEAGESGEEPTAAAARTPASRLSPQARTAQMPPPVYPPKGGALLHKPRENINPHGELSFLQSHKSQQILIKTHHPWCICAWE